VIICNESFYFIYLSYALFTCKKHVIVCICLIGHKYSVKENNLYILIKRPLTATYGRNFILFILVVKNVKIFKVDSLT